MENKCPSCGFTGIIAGDDRCEQCLHSLQTRDLPRPKQGEKLQQVMMTAPISELITGEDLLVCHCDDTLDKVVSIFQKERKNCIIVLKDKKLVGIISYRDLLFRVIGVRSDLENIKAEEVMTGNPEYVRPEDPIAHVINKMAMGGFRHVPVLSVDEVPLSIISIKDLLVYLDQRD